jgi:hypothetical protein
MLSKRGAQAKNTGLKIRENPHKNPKIPHITHPRKLQPIATPPAKPRNMTLL